MIIDLLHVTLAFLMALLFTRAMLGYAMHRQLLDVPNERSSHEIPTPRGGGVSIVFVFIIGLSILRYRNLVGFDEYLAFAVGGVVAAAIGFGDDHWNVPAGWRLIAHFIAAGWALFWIGGFPAFSGGLSVWVVSANLFWLVGLVWFLNSYNFMDGIDGIAGAEAIFITSAAGIMSLWSGAVTDAEIALLLMAAVGGFLFWNLPPAHIFMGDVGSGFLGLVLGVLAMVSVKHGHLTVCVWMILFGVFIVDAVITIIRRMKRGACWYKAHRTHAYQHAARFFGGHGRVTGAVTGINALWLLPLAIAAHVQPHLGPLIVFIAYIPLIWLAFKFHAGLDKDLYKICLSEGGIKPS